jgi:hypothetical protein
MDGNWYGDIAYVMGNWGKGVSEAYSTMCYRK